LALTSTGAIAVDDRYRTSADNIYAIGDVIDRVQLTPVAIAEGMVVADNLFNGKDRTLDYAGIPTAVFCQPNIGTVGLTEAQARHRHTNVRIFESTFRPMKHTMSGRTERTMMKLVVEADTDRVVGAHMVGPDAGEIIQGLGVALKAGATKAQFDSTIGIHPTAAEEFVTMREPVR
jgi:glutathione reductase (NADPH)